MDALDKQRMGHGFVLYAWCSTCDLLLKYFRVPAMLQWTLVSELTMGYIRWGS